MQPASPSGHVIAVARDSEHSFSKPEVASIVLVEGRGIEGDAHFGATVQHRSHKSRTPDAPNLRQVHLIHTELLQELRTGGFDVVPGALGENVVTGGIDLLALPRDTELVFPDGARLRVTGLRNPCVQLNGLQPGLMKAVLDRDADGALVRKSGVMAVVLEGGTVRAGDSIDVVLPAGPPVALQPV
ncbi:MOSC domain-containing protein [Planctomonas psychrotolerans]|uniref:MOSC domain-containing protein n=1 Tax=Planctomonas psychrotolerans TaxID=2528712 RepID=UPI00123A6847|nr:MOSC domain-containing protein [Planctomonas psychrotolerans]